MVHVVGPATGMISILSLLWLVNLPSVSAIGVIHSDSPECVQHARFWYCNCVDGVCTYYGVDDAVPVSLADIHRLSRAFPAMEACMRLLQLGDDAADLATDRSARVAGHFCTPPMTPEPPALPSR